MRDADSAARLHQMMYTWYGDYIQGGLGNDLVDGQAGARPVDDRDGTADRCRGDPGPVR